MKRRACSALLMLVLAACVAQGPEPLELAGRLARRGAEPDRRWTLVDEKGKLWYVRAEGAWAERLKPLEFKPVRLRGQRSDDPAGDEIKPEAVEAL